MSRIDWRRAKGGRKLRIDDEREMIERDAAAKWLEGKIMHDPYSVEKRRPLTSKQRLKLFLEHQGVCCLCHNKIDGVREMWDEHVNPLWLDGDNSASNRAPAHERCAREKTARETRTRAKGRRVAEKHAGAHRPKGPPMPGSKRSRYKKKMNGKVELR